MPNIVYTLIFERVLYSNFINGVVVRVCWGYSAATALHIVVPIGVTQYTRTATLACSSHSSTMQLHLTCSSHSGTAQLFAVTTLVLHYRRHAKLVRGICMCKNDIYWCKGYWDVPKTKVSWKLDQNVRNCSWSKCLYIFFVVLPMNSANFSLIFFRD